MPSRHVHGLRKAMVGALAATLALTACGGGEASEGDPDETAAATNGVAATEVSANGELGPPEKTDLTVALPFPDFTQFAMYSVATELGYYDDEGLTVEVITADDVVAAVASGSADVGIDSAGTVIDAVGKGVGVSVLSGHFCRQNFDFATQPDVTSVDDLAGSQVVLAGTPGDPAQFERDQVLKEEGWDLDTVETELVYPGPDSAAWREFLVAGRVSLVPFYDDDQAALEEYGANFIVQTIRNWPNDLHVVRDTFTEENPNTAVRFLRATMKAIDHIVAPGVGEVPTNKDAVLDIYEADGFDVASLRDLDSPWVLGGHFFCPNLYFDEAAWDGTIERQQLDPVPFEDNVDLTVLQRAQALMERDNSAPADVDYP